MRIAQVAPLNESVPPKLYGGTERVVSYLTEELVRLGHDVTLFASGDSDTAAELAPCCERGLRLGGCPDTNIPHILMLEKVCAQAERFDVIHFHIDVLHLPVARRLPVPSITTLHGRLDVPYLDQLYGQFNDVPLVSISDAQRRPIPRANWVGTVHHGLPDTLYPCSTTPGDYLVFAGRIAPEKRPDLAIQIARRARMPLRIAAKVSAVDQPYFNQVIAPMLDQPGIEWLGEINDSQKADLLCGALALLFPIDWPEPFGLVVIEAMACGTPVIAFPRGSVPEIIDHGQSGLIVHNVDQAVEAIGLARTMSRQRCRDCFDARFTADRMARDYLALYRRIAFGTGALPVHSTPGVVHG
ncbi:MAG: glycosyltransferase family 4 protein [Phycisphaerales bacterium]|nr:glycosyltransferase family 4 protein [Phycisphaerales bacterium]